MCNSDRVARDIEAFGVRFRLARAPCMHVIDCRSLVLLVKSTLRFAVNIPFLHLGQVALYLGQEST